jgi:hypothetical protein
MRSDCTEIQRALATMAFDDFAMTIVGATISRGDSAPSALVRSLTLLIEAVSGAGLSEIDRGRVVDSLRNAADHIEAELLKKRGA